MVKRAFERDGGRSGQHWAVDDVGVADDPADVGGGPPDVLGLDVEDPVGHAGDPDRVAAVSVNAHLGSRRGAGGGEDVGRLVGFHRRPRAVAALTGGEEVVPAHLLVAADDRAVRQAALDDDGLHDLTRALILKRASDEVIERHVASAAVGGVGAEDGLGLGQLDPFGDRAGAESGEDDQVHRANPGAGEHQRDRLIVGRHVDRDAVAPVDADGAQRGGHALYVAQQLRVGVDALCAVLVQADQRGPAAVAVGDLRVEAGVGEVGLAADEPAEGGNLLGRPLENLVPLAEPGDAGGGLGPEGVGFVERSPLNLADDGADQIDV